MVSYAIIALFAIFAVGAFFTTYYILKFFAGAVLWSLAIFWVFNPLVEGVSVVNNVIIVVLFFGGLAFMLMPFWYPGRNNGQGGFGLRVPKIFGGESEDDENRRVSRSRRTMIDRNDDYRGRVNVAMRGRRRR